MIIPLPFHYWPDLIRSSSSIHHSCDRSNWTHFSDHYQPALAIFTPRFMGQIHPLNSIFFDESFSEIFFPPFSIVCELCFTFCVPGVSPRRLSAPAGRLHCLPVFLFKYWSYFQKQCFSFKSHYKLQEVLNKAEAIFVCVGGFFHPPPNRHGISWWSVSFCRSEDISEWHAGGCSPNPCVTAPIIHYYLQQAQVLWSVLGTLQRAYASAQTADSASEKNNFKRMVGSPQEKE